MKTLYEIRYFPTPDSYSKGLGRKLRSYRAACRLVRRLKARGLEAFKAPLQVNLPAKKPAATFTTALGIAAAKSQGIPMRNTRDLDKVMGW